MPGLWSQKSQIFPFESCTEEGEKWRPDPWGTLLGGGQVGVATAGLVKLGVSEASRIAIKMIARKVLKPPLVMTTLD